MVTLVAELKGCLPPPHTHWPSRVEVIGGYHEYTDVKSCQDVVHLYHLLWSATILNIVALFLGIITAAVLGGFKDMVGGFKPGVLKPFVGFDVLVCAPQIPSAATESSSDAEAIAAPVPSEIHPPSAPYNAYYNAAPCLPPYTTYDLQVSHLFHPQIQAPFLLLKPTSLSSALHRAPTCFQTPQACQTTPSLEPVTCGPPWSPRATLLLTIILMRSPPRTAPETCC